MADGGEGSSRRIIPGPAGILQRAMRRRERGKGLEVDYIPTQEYLERALVEPQHDDSFTDIPWRTVMDYGYLAMHEYTSISTIPEIARRDFPSARIPLVVGIVQAVEPNGLGDLIIELKDESGSIKGSVHHKVMEGNFFGKIVVGTAMVITDAVIFSPSNTAHYLNITHYNVSLIVTKEGETITSFIIPKRAEDMKDLTLKEVYHKYGK